MVSFQLVFLFYNRFSILFDVESSFLDFTIINVYNSDIAYIRELKGVMCYEYFDYSCWIRTTVRTNCKY